MMKLEIFSTGNKSLQNLNFAHGHRIMMMMESGRGVDDVTWTSNDDNDDDVPCVDIK